MVPSPAPGEPFDPQKIMYPGLDFSLINTLQLHNCLQQDKYHINATKTTHINTANVNCASAIKRYAWHGMFQLHWVPITTNNKMQKKTARYKWVLVVDNFFNTAKKSAYYIQVLVVTEFVVSGTQCNT